MIGNAVCSIDSWPPQKFKLTNVILTFISGEALAILSRESGGDPEEILVLQPAILDIVSSSEIDLEGFVCPDEGEKCFYRCRIKFQF